VIRQTANLAHACCDGESGIFLIAVFVCGSVDYAAAMPAAEQH
jgi:hypothetical protein